MPQEESKLEDKVNDQAALEEAVEELKNDKNPQAEEEDDEDDDENEEQETSASDPKTQKKKSKKKKLKSALSAIKAASNSDAPTSLNDKLPSEVIDAMTPQQLQTLLTANPSLQGTIPSNSTAGQRDLREALKEMTVADTLTGMSRGKNAKDMASYKFWSTQPVPRFDEKAEASSSASQEVSKISGEKKPSREGPIQIVDPAKVPQKPSPLVEGFEWCEMDLLDETELEEVRDLLTHHYVEDNEAMFRFNYSFDTLNWALKAPGWKKQWHVGVRASKSRKLVAFISAIPVHIRVRANTLDLAEVNFLCVHKKLRSKRLAPVLITEITRRCNVEGIYQAIYTGGVVLPKPVASCRYYHRALDWEKLYNVGFSPLPSGSTKTRQIVKYKLPERTATPGLRQMKAEDAEAVADLLTRYSKRVDLAQEFSKDEVLHWLLDKETDLKSPKRVVWTYVVENGGRITDFVSFYCLESTVIHGSGNHSVIRAAYLFYYGTETAFEKPDDNEALKVRLNALVRDACILAKQARFDVFNALTLLDNPLFLKQQLFGPGDGSLHYYLFNYRTAEVASGVDEQNNASENHMGGVGVVML
ncbi:hypothetical protein MBLNU457_4749t1 [Dothideomycetes sp. NU457]